MKHIRLYGRVSTSDQNLRRQIPPLIEHAETELGGDTSNLQQTPTEFAEEIDEAGGIDEYRLGEDTWLHADKSTGTDTDRSAYRTMMDAVEDGRGDVVAAHSVSRVARSISDLADTADRITEEHGADIHIIKQGLRLSGDDETSDPYQRALSQLLGVFAELEAEIKRQNTKEGIEARMNSEEGYWHGPAPLGFEKSDGHLTQGPNYHDVVATLEMVQDDDLSKRRAARELGTSRKSIYRALDNAHLYGLGDASQEVGGDA